MQKRLHLGKGCKAHGGDLLRLQGQIFDLHVLAQNVNIVKPRRKMERKSRAHAGKVERKTKFLAHLARGGLRARLTVQGAAAGRHIPQTRPAFFGGLALLNEQPAGVIKNAGVHDQVIVTRRKLLAAHSQAAANWNGHAHNGCVRQQNAANANAGHMSALTGSGLPCGQRDRRRHAASRRRSPGPAGQAAPVHRSLPDPRGRRAHTRARPCAAAGRTMPGRANTDRGTASSQAAATRIGIGSDGSAWPRERERVRRVLMHAAYA